MGFRRWIKVKIQISIIIRKNIHVGVVILFLDKFYDSLNDICSQIFCNFLYTSLTRVLIFSFLVGSLFLFLECSSVVTYRRCP